MDSDSKGPIFFDPTNHRLRYYKLMLAALSLILTVAFLATLFSIAKKENFSFNLV